MAKIILIAIFIILTNSATMGPTPLWNIPKFIEGFSSALYYKDKVPSAKLCANDKADLPKQILTDIKLIAAHKYPDAENALEDIFDKLNDLTQACGDDAVETERWALQLKKNFNLSGYKERVNENYDEIILTAAHALICYHKNDYFCYGQKVGTIFGIAFQLNYRN